MTHNFRESLERSHRYADAPWWTEVYERFFPDCQVQDMRKDGWWQRAGIDRRVHLANATTVTVDEKVRERDWPDFALEAFSEWTTDRDRQKRGWMWTAACDYLAYAFVPSRTCYLLPMRELQRAWESDWRDWWRLAAKRQGGFRFADAPNESHWGSYTTRSICVPKPIVFDAISKAMVAIWSEAWPALDAA